jgi:hypothetical protein
MKQIRMKIRTWWFWKVIAPQMKKFKAESVMANKDALVTQMWASGINFGTINKWLSYMRQPTIKHYMVHGPNNDQLRIYYHTVTQEERKNAPGNIVNVA